MSMPAVQERFAHLEQLVDSETRRQAELLEARQASFEELRSTCLEQGTKAVIGL